jgi:hypothetical protein
VKCPAGNVVGDDSIRCNVEKSTINGRLDPVSVEGFCCGNYEKCPSWQLAQKAHEMGREVQLHKSPREQMMAELAKLSHAERARVVAEAMARKEQMEAARNAEGRVWVPGPIRGRKA